MNTKTINLAGLKKLEKQLLGLLEFFPEASCPEDDVDLGRARSIYRQIDANNIKCNLSPEAVSVLIDYYEEVTVSNDSSVEDADKAIYMGLYLVRLLIKNATNAKDLEEEI